MSPDGFDVACSLLWSWLHGGGKWATEESCLAALQRFSGWRPGGLTEDEARAVLVVAEVRGWVVIGDEHAQRLFYRATGMYPGTTVIVRSVANHSTTAGPGF